MAKNNNFRNAALIILAVLSLVMSAIFVYSACGDSICEKGQNNAIVFLNYTDGATTYNITTGEPIIYDRLDIYFTLNLTYINETTKATVFDFNDTLEISISKGILYSNLTEGISFRVNDVVIGSGGEYVSCPQDCDKCNSTAECNDNDECTTDLCGGIPKKCLNTLTAGCTKDAFKKQGETFILGKNACRKEYIFSSANKDNGTIIIKSTLPETIYNISYSGQPSNQYGYLAHLRVDIFGQVFVYTLRYNENKSELYLGEADLSCPFLDACLSNKDCDDHDLCTIDECDGIPLRCTYKKIAYCKSGDNCCPARCTYADDNDCVNPNKCESNSDCDDNRTCTKDICSGEPKVCGNEPLTDCVTGDGCCPSDCSYYQDQDCERKAECGDKLCEGNETITCCTDCGCSGGLECKNNICAKPFLLQAKEFLERNANLTKMKQELLDKKYVLNDTVVALNNAGKADFSYIFSKNGDFAYINGTIDADFTLFSELYSPGRFSINIPFLWIILLAVILVGGTTGVAVHKKIKDKKKEEYYKKLLQQRYGMMQQGPQHYYHPIHQRQPVMQRPPVRAAQPVRQYPQRYPQRVPVQRYPQTSQPNRNQQQAPRYNSGFIFK